jgi:hypothetical protein
MGPAYSPVKSIQPMEVRMVYAKRLILCIILGFFTGVLCYLSAKSANIPLTPGATWSTIFNRIFIGFAIGISAWRMNYMLHGIALGLLFSLQMSLGALDSGGFNSFIMIEIAGALWGFLIELLTTKVFKAPMKLAETS